MTRSPATDREPRRARRTRVETEVEIDRRVRVEFSRRLRAWFRANARDLPWRRTRNAYEVLVSELMLQQTQVSRVETYYAEFLARFPTLADVARAKPSRVMEAWDGLGYYARARNLHQLARRVTDGGRRVEGTLPAEPSELRALPGIGPYTAGAVASFAYERRAALVDTNVARVLKRAFAPEVEVKKPRGQRLLWQIAESLLPRTGRATWGHNQALMELGALVCMARVAHCGRCPVRGVCATARAAAAGESSITSMTTKQSPERHVRSRTRGKEPTRGHTRPDRERRPPLAREAAPARR